MGYPVFQTNYPYGGATYPQPAPMIPPTPSIPAGNSQFQCGIIWVQGEAGAKSFHVAPNTTVDLWDSESQTIYLKSADASGMPSMKILDYTIRTPENTQTPLQGTQNPKGVDYATKEDLNALKGEILDLVKEELKA